MEQILSHPAPKYALIFGALLALTALTVVISRVHLGMAGNWGLAITVAMIKGSLVALYFMHLKFEKKQLWWVLALPIFYALALIIGLLPDLVFGV